MKFTVGDYEIETPKLREQNYHHATADGRMFVMLTQGLWTVISSELAPTILLLNWTALRNHHGSDQDKNTVYAIANCRINGRRTKIRLHVLVKLLETEIKSTRQRNINHIDGCGLNNVSENLEFTTAGDNCRHEPPPNVHRYLIPLPLELEEIINQSNLQEAA